MKRAIAFFIIAMFIMFVGIVIYAWVNPDFKATIDTGLRGLGGEIYLRLQGGWLNLMSMASTNGTTFLAYTLGILVVGGVTWVGFKTFLWDKRPTWMGNSASAKLPVIREEPRDIIITQSPVPTTQQKEKEVTATESASTAS